MKRFSTLFIYLICLTLAILSFYFSIASNLWIWFFPDELAAATFFNQNDLLGCTKFYYLYTTINRISAAYGVCGMAAGASFFEDPFLGWVSIRMVWYVLLPLSISFMLKNLLRLSFFSSNLLALIISSLSIFIIADSVSFMFGLDLAIYLTATCSFFILLALFSQSLTSGRSFMIFCLLFAINLNSHEIFLVISGFLIPLFLWHRHPFGNTVSYKFINLWIRDILRDWKFLILCLIYVFSALLTLLAPGLAMRQNTWPSSGKFVDGLMYMLLSIEEVTYHLLLNFPWILILLLLGVVTRLYNNKRPLNCSKLLYIFLLTSPLMYLLFTSYLIGITPSLWVGGTRTENFQLVEKLFDKTPILLAGDFAIRQNIFLYAGLLLDVFLIGFWSGARIINLIPANLYQWLFKISLFSSLSLLFLFHPDGIGSVRAMSALLNSKLTLDQYKSDEIKLSSGRILDRWISRPLFSAVGATLFQRNHMGQHESAVAAILIDRYLNTHRGEAISIDIFDLIYDQLSEAYRVSITEPWIGQTLNMYGVFLSPSSPCVRWLPELKKKPSSCYEALGQQELLTLLKHKLIGTSQVLPLIQPQGMKLEEFKNHCTQLVETSEFGEHFVATEPINLGKGWYYFIFETLPTDTELHIYLVSNEVSILFPWRTSARGQRNWSIMGKPDLSQPIFIQSGISPNLESVSILIYSASPHKLQVRWQHGKNGNTIYKGNKTTRSNICLSQFGQLNNAN